MQNLISLQYMTVCLLDLSRNYNFLYSFFSSVYQLIIDLLVSTSGSQKWLQELHTS